jgi:hypothetical protein
MNHSSILYLKDAGYSYTSAESPQLWTHLENQVLESQPIGAKFNRLSMTALENLIAMGEDALVEALVAQHRRTGKLDKVHQVIDLPFVVGTFGIIPIEGTDDSKLLKLVDGSGTPKEHVIQVLPVESDVIPCTRQATVTGGAYSDGYTMGLYGLSPGDGAKERRFGGKCAYLATAQDIKILASEMELKVEDIVTVTRQECEAMLARVKALLGT